MQSYQDKALSDEINVKSQIFAMMAYMGVLCLVPLLLNKRNDFANFHVRQGLVIWMTEVCAVIFLYLPIFGRFFFTATITICVFFSIAGILSVFLEKAWRFPFFSIVSERL